MSVYMYEKSAKPRFSFKITYSSTGSINLYICSYPIIDIIVGERNTNDTYSTYDERDSGCIYSGLIL